MNALCSTRVVVVDDEFSEAEPLIRGLSKLGIGSIYYNGVIEELPQSPLSGIRLVFLDLHLTVASAGSHATLNATIGVLTKILRCTKGEVGIVCWTKHPEEKDDFESLLKERLDKFESAFLICIPKNEFFREKISLLETKLFAGVNQTFKSFFSQLGAHSDERIGDFCKENHVDDWEKNIGDVFKDAEGIGLAPHHFDISNLSARIEGAISDKHASRLIWDWEQKVHDAASSATSLLYEIARDDLPEGADDDMLRLLAALVFGAGGSSVSDVSSSAASLFEGLNPIHSDFLDQFARQPAENEAYYLALLKKVLEGKALMGKRQAQVNSALLTAKILNENNRFEPGNLYLPASEADAAGCPHSFCQIEMRQLADGMLSPKNDTACYELKRKIDGHKKLELTPEQVSQLKNELHSARETLFENRLRNCMLGLLEISPACDFSNKKYRPARFIGCLLVPDCCVNEIQEGDFIRRLKPMLLPNMEGIWHILLNSRFVFGVSNPTKKISTVPLVRVRLPLLIDLQAWFASQAARPGHISV